MVELLTRQQRKRKAEARERANKTLSQYTQTIFSAIDTRNEEAKKNPALAAQISCRRGCAACCNQIVKITILEAAHIVHTHRAVVERLRPQLEEQAKKLVEMKLDVVPYDIPKEQALEANNLAAQKWFITRTPCAFLSKNNECSIYASRPLVCRTYHVVDKGPAICEEIPYPGEKDFAVPQWETPGANEATIGMVQMHFGVQPKAPVLPVQIAVLLAMKGQWYDG